MTGTSSVFQFYDSPRQLICFWRTFFRFREADLLKSNSNCAHGLPRLPGSISHTQAVLQTDTLFYIHCGQTLQRINHVTIKQPFNATITQPCNKNIAQ
jgi:hypothetical protein